MAQQISKSWLELQLMAEGGAPCKELVDFLKLHITNLQDNTQIDAKWLIDNVRNIGGSHLIIYSLIRGISDEERNQLTIYLLQQINEHLPETYNQSVLYINQLVDYLQNPTEQKKIDIQQLASNININFEDVELVLIQRSIKGLCNILGYSSLGRGDVKLVFDRLLRIALDFSNVDKLETTNIVLGKIEQIIGLVD